jgi:hypothetical protein
MEIKIPLKYSCGSLTKVNFNFLRIILLNGIEREAKKCCFCNSEDTVEHLFLSCSFARMICGIFHLTIPPPTNINNMFGDLLNGIDAENKPRIRIGVNKI